jgi:hypothetical protein
VTPADHPRAYHRRISEEVIGGNVPTLCCRVVNYQQTMGSLDDVDCAGCLHNADAIVSSHVQAMKELLSPAFVKSGRKPPV